MMTQMQTEPGKFQIRRFATGFGIAAGGMTVILMIAARVLDPHSVGGRFAMPLVAIGVLSGVVLIGAGFAMMVVASPGFEEQDAGRMDAFPEMTFDDSSGQADGNDVAGKQPMDRNPGPDSAAKTE